MCITIVTIFKVLVLWFFNDNFGSCILSIHAETNFLKATINNNIASVRGIWLHLAKRQSHTQALQRVGATDYGAGW